MQEPTLHCGKWEVLTGTQLGKGQFWWEGQGKPWKDNM